MHGERNPLPLIFVPYDMENIVMIMGSFDLTTSQYKASLELSRGVAPGEARRIRMINNASLQKWFHIPTDPELENQINDRISLKKLLGLPLDKPSPDHSPFSRFRSRLSKEAMVEVNQDRLLQVARRDLSIAEGGARDARLTTSASRVGSSDELTKLKKKRTTPKGTFDRTVRPLACSRDRDLDWTLKDDQPHCGFKEHASVDVTPGFILAPPMTLASVHETTSLPSPTVLGWHRKDPIETVSAYKGSWEKTTRGFYRPAG